MDWTFSDKGIDLNAYIKLDVGGKPLKTKVIDRKKGDSSVDFNQTFTFGVPWPAPNDRLKLEVMDQDMMGDQAIGSIVLSIRDIVSTYSDKPQFQWLDVYGAPTSSNN